MRNVYTNKFTFFALVTLFLALFIDLFVKNEIGDYWQILVFVGVFVLILGHFFIFPFFSYDEIGFEKKSLFGGVNGSYKWSEVGSVVIRSNKSSGVWVSLKNSKSVLFLNYFFIAGYDDVICDVVRFVRKGNPNAEIDKKLLDLAVGKGFKQKPIILLILLILLLGLMWSMARFHWFVIG